MDVVRRSVDERLGCQLLTLGESEAAAAHGGEHRVVRRRAGHDRDTGVVLGSCPDHGRAADVDLLDALIGAGARGDGLGER